MVESLFWNPAFDVAPAARWWAMSKDWWRLRPGAFLAPASSFFVVELRILGDPWIVGEAKHHSCFLSDIVSVEGGHQKPFVRTPLVLQTINQLIKWFFHNMTQEPVYLSNVIHFSSLVSALQQNQPRTASQLSEQTIQEQMTAHEKEANDQLSPHHLGFWQVRLPWLLERPRC